MAHLLVTARIRIDLKEPTRTHTVDAICGDGDTRAVEISLFNGGEPWRVPLDTLASVCCAWPYGAKAEYDSCADGTPAVTIDGNRIMVVLTSTALCVPGTVYMYLVLTNRHTGDKLNITFNANVIEAV